MSLEETTPNIVQNIFPEGVTIPPAPPIAPPSPPAQQQEPGSTR